MSRFVLRPASEFFHTPSFSVAEFLASESSHDNTKKPDLKRIARERLMANLGYFQANYTAVIASFLTLTCFFRPVFFLGLLLIIGIGYYLFALRDTVLQPIIINKRALNHREILLSFITISFSVCLIFGGFTPIWAVFYALIVILVHAIVRVRAKNVGGSNLNFIQFFDEEKKGKLEDEADDTPSSNIDVEAAAQSESHSSSSPLPSTENDVSSSSFTHRGATSAPANTFSEPPVANEAGSTTDQQQQFKNQFRANMRNKYLRKKD